jgi:hypothetical protein
MVRFLFPLFLVAAAAVAQTPAEEPHFREAGSSAILAHSTFAHGYRHGYEAGYHIGNTDINMGRSPRAKLAELHGVKTGYSAHLGPRKVFDKGFQAGLNAGYDDGYLGRTFRAVDTLRAVAASLENSPSSTDPDHVDFDQGFLSGYDDGFKSAGSDPSSTEQMDFHDVGCTRLRAASRKDSSEPGSYCEGYRRGFALGHGDGCVLRPEGARMEASK